MDGEEKEENQKRSKNRRMKNALANSVFAVCKGKFFILTRKQKIRTHRLFGECSDYLRLV